MGRTGASGERPKSAASFSKPLIMPYHPHALGPFRRGQLNGVPLWPPRLVLVLQPGSLPRQVSRALPWDPSYCLRHACAM